MSYQQLAKVLTCHRDACHFCQASTPHMHLKCMKRCCAVRCLAGRSMRNRMSALALAVVGSERAACLDQMPFFGCGLQQRIMADIACHATHRTL